MNSLRLRPICIASFIRIILEDSPSRRLNVQAVRFLVHFFCVGCLFSLHLLLSGKPIRWIFCHIMFTVYVLFVWIRM